MKLYKVFLALGACLTLANCKFTFSGDGEVDPEPGGCLDRLYVVDELAPATTVEFCELDITKTPKKMVYFDGGWYGPSPNYRLSMEIHRTDSKVSAHVVTPTCTIDGAVSDADYLALNALTIGVDVKIDKAHMVDGGDEYLEISDVDSLDRLFLKNGDSTYNKPVVKDVKVAKAIRKQVNTIADAILKKCVSKNKISSVHLRQNVNPKSMVADKDAQVPHPKYTQVTEDLRVVHQTTGTRVYGYRKTISPTTTCTSQIDKVISSDASWRAATEKIVIVNSDAICAIAQGASAEDWSIVFPNYPRELEVKYSNGTNNIGRFGCQYANRVENAKEIENLLMSELAKVSSACRPNGY